MTRRLLTVLLFCSGAAGLVYEVVWSRLLALAVGVEATAVTAVLAAFMGGLALGAWVGGKVAGRASARPLRDYGALEILIALACLATPRVIDAWKGPLERAYASLGPGTSFQAVRAIACALVLIVPTTLMGATLPVLARAVAQRKDEVGEGVGGLYAANTFGAVLGALGAGFVLIPALGTAHANFLAAATSASVGIASILLHRKLGDAAAPAPAEAAPDKGDAIVSLPLALASFAISGASAMAFQLAWTRALGVVLGPTTYAFSLIVASTILGHAFGSARASRARTRDPLGTLAIYESAGALAALAAIPLFDKVPDLLIPTVNRAAGSGFAVHALAQFLVAFALVAVPAYLLGTAFPLVARGTASDLTRLGRTVGLAYALNSLGCVAGVVIGGTVLLPRLGIQRTAEAAAIGAAVAAALAALSSSRGSRVLAAAPLVVFLLAWKVIPEWKPLRFSSGAYLYVRDGKRLGGGSPESDECLYYREGFVGTVLVGRTTMGSLYLKLGGKVDAGTGAGDMRTQLLVGHIPALVGQEKPRRALLVGVGSGVTLRALRADGIERIDVVELDPNVCDAVRQTVLKKVSRDALDREPNKPRLLIEDARAAFAFEPGPYDLIVNEPSNPWIAGIGNLFTIEAFQEARARLSPRGVFAQWLHAGYASRETFKLVVRTFLEVYPDATLWESAPSTDYILISGNAPLALAPERIEAKLTPEIRTDLATVELRDAEDVLWHFCMGPEQLRKFAGEGPLNRDDDARLEHLAPRYMYDRYDVLRDKEFFEAREMPREIADRPEIQELASARKAALASMALAGRGRALEYAILCETKVPGRGAARPMLRASCAAVAMVGASDERERAALPIFLERISGPPDPAPVHASPEIEAEIYEHRVRLGIYPDEVKRRVRLAELLLARGDAVSARLELSRALEVDPDSEAARALLAKLGSGGAGGETGGGAPR